MDRYPDPPVPSGNGPRDSRDKPGSAATDLPPGSPVADAPTVAIVGYLSSTATADGSRRLYLDSTLTNYIDVPDAARNIVSWVDVDKAVGLVRLMVRAAAKIDFGHILKSVEAAMVQGLGQVQGWLNGVAPGGSGTGYGICGGPGGMGTGYGLCGGPGGVGTGYGACGGPGGTGTGYGICGGPGGVGTGYGACGGPGGFQTSIFTCGIPTIPTQGC